MPDNMPVEELSEASWCIHCEHLRDNHETTGCSYQYDNCQYCGCRDFLSLRMVKAQAWSEGWHTCTRYIADEKQCLLQGFAHKGPPPSPPVNPYV